MPGMFSTDWRKQPTLPWETSCLPLVLSCLVQCFEGSVYCVDEGYKLAGGTSLVATAKLNIAEWLSLVQLKNSEEEIRRPTITSISWISSSKIKSLAVEVVSVRRWWFKQDTPNSWCSIFLCWWQWQWILYSLLTQSSLQPSTRSSTKSMPCSPGQRRLWVSSASLSYEENIKFVCCLRYSHLHCGHLHGRC